MRKIPFIILLSALVASPVAAVVTEPEAAPESPEIKTLFNEEMRYHPTGFGMEHQGGPETPAYLSPKKVLEMWEALDLSADQFGKTKEIYENMVKELKRVGDLLGKKQEALAAMMEAAKPDENELRSLVMEKAALEGELRFIHLRANLKTREVLTPEQIKMFKEMQRPKMNGDHHHH